MNVHSRCCFSNGCDYVEIGLSCVVGMDSTLHTDLGSAALPCVDAAPSYFFGTYVIRLTAQILAATAFRKSTELTFEIADVGVIDIAVNHIADCVARHLFAQRVCFGHRD